MLRQLGAFMESSLLFSKVNDPFEFATTRTSRVSMMTLGYFIWYSLTVSALQYFSFPQVNQDEETLSKVSPSSS